MKFNHSRRNILFLEPISKFSAFFAIVPAYNFQTDTFTGVIFFKCFSVFLTCAFSVFAVINVKQRSILRASQGYRHDEVLDIFLELGGLATFSVTSLAAAFWNRETWGELIKKMRLLESKPNLNSVSLKGKSCMKNPNFLVALGMTFYALCIVVIGPSAPTFIFSILLYASEFLISNIVYNIALSISYKFEDINYTLSNTGKDVILTVKLVEKLYFNAMELVDIFNKLFGWPILLLTIHTIIQVLVSLVNTAIASRGSVTIFLVGVVFSGISLFGPIIVVTSCDKAARTSKKLLSTCSKLEQDFPFCAKEIVKLECQIRKHHPVFTAADFYELNRTTLLHILSTITTYFIVEIQLNNANIL